MPETSGQENQALPEEPTPGTGVVIGLQKPSADAQNVEPSHGLKGRLLRCWRWARRHKKLSIPAAAVCLLAVIMAVPPSRYALAGLALRREFTVTVVEQGTHTAVSNATVSLAGGKALTDSKGRATLKAAVGTRTLTVSKKYYAGTSQHVLVPIFSQKHVPEIGIRATGRQVTVRAVDKISGKPIRNASFEALGTAVSSDNNGWATMVLPATMPQTNVTVSAKGYNAAHKDVLINASTLKPIENIFELVPAGTVYFLSTQSGKVDVVKANLDGTSRKVAVAGTGHENQYGTQLLAAYDWRYLALLANRDGKDNPYLYVVDTANDSLAKIDAPDGDITIVGWSGPNLIYMTRVNQSGGDDSWKPQYLKAYNAATRKTTTLDQTASGLVSGVAAYLPTFERAYIINGQVVYTQDFSLNSQPTADTKAAVYTVRPDGSGKKILKSWTDWSSLNGGYVYVNSFASKPDKLYIALSAGDDQLYTYQDGEVSAVTGKKAVDFYSLGDGTTYLFSPTGDQSSWMETRDGKGTFFVGDASGDGGQQVAQLSDYQLYGWFTDKYLLVAKDNELYILSAIGSAEGREPVKIGSYFRGAGGLLYGYGGL